VSPEDLDAQNDFSQFAAYFRRPIIDSDPHPDDYKAFLAYFQGKSIQEILHSFQAMPIKRLLLIISNAPYGPLVLIPDHPLFDVTKNVFLALNMHLESLLGIDGECTSANMKPLPPGYSSTPVILNWYKQLFPCGFSRPSLPVISALMLALERFPSATTPNRQNALICLLSMNVICPSAALHMEESEVAEMSKDPQRIRFVGPKSLRNIMLISRRMGLERLPSALAKGLLHAASCPQFATAYPDYWEKWSSLQHVANPNLHAALLSELVSRGAGVGVLRELVPAFTEKVLYPLGLGKGDGSKGMSVAGYSLLLRFVVGLVLDEDRTATACEAPLSPRTQLGFLAAVAPLLTLAVKGINQHYKLTPRGFWDRLMDSLGSYNAISGPQSKHNISHYPCFTLGRSGEDAITLKRWVRNINVRHTQNYAVHKVMVDLGGLLSAGKLLDVVRLIPGASDILLSVPSISPKLMEEVSTSIIKARNAEVLVHGMMMQATDMDRDHFLDAEDEVIFAKLTSSLSGMQVLVTRRIITAMNSVVKAASRSSGVEELTIAGVTLAPQQVRSLASLGIPSTHTRVLDYSLDVAWPDARLAIEIDGPYHFLEPCLSALGEALEELARDQKKSKASSVGGFVPEKTHLFHQNPFPLCADVTTKAFRNLMSIRAMKHQTQTVGIAAAKDSLARSHTERVRLEALKLLKWNLVHVHFLDMVDIVPVLIHLLKGKAVSWLDLPLEEMESMFATMTEEDFKQEILQTTDNPPALRSILRATYTMDAYIANILKTMSQNMNDKN